MGLSIVHGIIADHNGVITVRSTPGEGTTFDIYLPRISQIRTADHAEPPEEPMPPGKSSILFVDDEVSIAMSHHLALKGFGYEVISKTSSLDALEVFRSAPHRFDLVITDQTMPQMTGEQLATELRRIRPDIPVILCTGFSHVMHAEKSKAMGIDAFLMKPIVARDLAVMIRKVLEEHGL